jgi:membrane-associated phospholipid phosphatase
MVVGHMAIGRIFLTCEKRGLNRLSHHPFSLTIPNDLLDRLADLLSYILHPAVLMLLTVVLVSTWTRGNLAWVLLDVGILIIGLLPGLLYIYVKTRQGHFSHYHLLKKEERHIALPLLFVGVLASFGLYKLTQAPTIMMRGMAIGLFAGLGAIIISRFWKISLHAAVAMGCAGLFIPLSWQVAVCFALLGLIVGVARLRARHHTPAQVIVGWIYGFGMGSLSVIWLRNVVAY